METFVVTGANRGIGLELVRQLLSDNKDVIATCRNPQSAIELSELNANKKLTILQLEVTDANSVNEFYLQLSDRRIDVLINNAGEMGSEQQTLKQMDVDAWLQTFKINTIAPFQIATLLLTNLKKSDRPRIVSISSQMGSLNRSSSGSYAYRSSKAALNKVMQVMAYDLKSEGIIVCPVHPGWVKTDMGGSMADITAAQSASGLIEFIDKLNPEQSGRFWKYNGEEHAW